MRNENLTQELATVGLLTPAATRAAGSYVTDPCIDGSIYDRLVAYTLVGTLTGSATVKSKWQSCSGSASSDANWTDVNSACITSTFSSASNDKISELELRLDQNPSGSRYYRVLTSAATSSWTGAVLVLGRPNYKAAKDVDLAAVAEKVVY